MSHWLLGVSSQSILITKAKNHNELRKMNQTKLNLQSTPTLQILFLNYCETMLTQL